MVLAWLVDSPECEGDVLLSGDFHLIVSHQHHYGCYLGRQQSKAFAQTGMWSKAEPSESIGVRIFVLPSVWVKLGRFTV